LQPLDTTCRLGRLDFTATPADAAEGTLERAGEHASIALAAESVGGTQRILDLAIAHARTRVQ